MTRLRIGTSFWLDGYQRRAPAFPRLRGHRTTDVVVVGGGVTGSACAHLLSRAGIAVTLVEARRIGRGSTSASTALLMQEPDVDFGDLANRYGTATARRIWQSSRDAVSSFARTLRQIKADTHLRNLPSICLARHAEAAHDLHVEWQRRHRAGIPGRWLTPSLLKARAGVDAGGAILTPGNAEVDPYRACLALARSARRSRAAIFEHSKVRRIRASRTGVQVELEHGTIAASHVIIATGYATREFKPLAGRFRMMNTYVITTPRLSAGVRREMRLSHAMLWDTERPYHYARWTADNRLLFGGEDRPHRTGRSRRKAIGARAESLAEDLGTLYPVLREVRPEYAWEGLFATTPDGLPYIGAHRRYPRHLFALGYGGNGMTFGFLAAKILRRALNGRERDGDELFAFNRHSD